MDWKAFIQVMKIDERAARAKYRTAARGARSQAVKNIFNKLAYEEEVHISVLEDFEKDLKKVLAGEKEH